jgi:hypothetical protein
MRIHSMILELLQVGWEMNEQNNMAMLTRELLKLIILNKTKANTYHNRKKKC